MAGGQQILNPDGSVVLNTDGSERIAAIDDPAGCCCGGANCWYLATPCICEEFNSGLYPKLRVPCSILNPPGGAGGPIIGPALGNRHAANPIIFYDPVWEWCYKVSLDSQIVDSITTVPAGDATLPLQLIEDCSPCCDNPAPCWRVLIPCVCPEEPPGDPPPPTYIVCPPEGADVPEVIWDGFRCWQVGSVVDTLPAGSVIATIVTEYPDCTPCCTAHGPPPCNGCDPSGCNTCPASFTIAVGASQVHYPFPSCAPFPVPGHSFPIPRVGGCNWGGGDVQQLIPPQFVGGCGVQVNFYNWSASLFCAGAIGDPMSVWKINVQINGNNAIYLRPLTAGACDCPPLGTYFLSPESVGNPFVVPPSVFLSA